jgi:hypothetical protein
MTNNPYSPPTAIVEDNTSLDAQNTQPPFFSVSILKLIVLSVCTLGLYEVYWFYKNWQLIKAREGSNISPAPRALFAVLYCYQCFCNIRDFEARAQGDSKLAAGLLATGWIVTTLLHKLPGAYGLISMFAFTFIIPVQMYANRINVTISPDHVQNSRFTGWNWVAVVIGLIVIPLAFIGALQPPR